MAGSIVGAQSASASGGADITCSVPAGRASGDVLVAIENTDWGLGTDAEMGPTSGAWTELGEWHHGGGDAADGIHVRIWGRTSDGTETSYTFNQGTDADGTATIVCLRGVTLTGLLISGAFAASGTSTRTAPSLPSVPTGAVLLCGAMLDPGGTTTWTEPTGMTELADVQSTTWTTTGIAGLAGPPNPSGTRDFTATGDQTGAGVVWSLALPASATGTTAAAGNAAGTGAARQPTATVIDGGANAGNAAGTGAARTPSLVISSNVPAGRATGTGQARTPAASSVDPIGTAILRDAFADCLLLVEAAFGADLDGDPAAWEWTDLTQDVQQAGGSTVSITVGRANEAATSQPAQCTMRLDNRSGDYSIGGQSQHWPYIRRNIPIRVRVDPGGGTFTTVFFGFADGWSPSWDITGRNAYVELSASGTLRRLKQNTSPVFSSIRRAILNRSDVVAYWPCEEGKDAKFIASGLPDGTPMTISGLAEQPYPKFAADDDSFACSAALPEVKLTTWQGVVPPYAGTGQVQVRWLMVAPELLGGTEHTIVSVYTTGSIVRWDLTYVNADSGNMKLYAVDSGGTRTEIAYVGFAVNNTVRQYGLTLRQNGGNVDVGIQVLAVGYVDGGVWNGTRTGATISACTAVTVAPNGDVDDTIIGHVTVQNAVTSIYSERAQLNANAGETATDRLQRLCAENDTHITITGDSDIAMGAQGVDDLLTLLRECETADQGLLYDGLGPGLAYVTGAERANQAAALTLDVPAGQLVRELTPVDDDQRNVNKVKAKRTDGSDATYEDVTGPLGTAAIGIYDDSIEVNIASDLDVIDYASWQVHLGTIGGYRYPQLHVNFAKNPELLAGWLATALSARVDVTGIDAVREQHPGGAAELLLEGYSMDIDQTQWTAQLNCAPFAPWRIGEYAATTGDVSAYVQRLHSDGSTLAAPAATGATSLSVATPSGPLWTTAADDFPLEVSIGGIRVTVTAISGASSPQTFTVQAVGKALPAGLDVDLWNPTVPGV